MFVLSNFIFAVAYLFHYLIFPIVFWLVFIRALVSWVSPDPYNPLVQFLYKTTEPLLTPFRKILPLSFNIGIDVSPLLLLLVIKFLDMFLIKTLFELAIKLR